MKQFKSTNKNLIINWHSKKQQTLCFQGRDGPTLRIASDIRQASADREGQESSTRERSYSMVSADLEGLKLDLLILQKKVEENANPLSANIQKPRGTYSSH